eukprot:TRINITY_DN75009_c0_g1_i1.p1 TRINITY_DN75009_c0_g1~~TRINITY_DN75009_c0_g1_i1.p1  ORF type:complete len:396 (-),score=41.89 TRINITY_DN75009_c0_g1_i1:248-1306(-)
MDEIPSCLDELVDRMSEASSPENMIELAELQAIKTLVRSLPRELQACMAVGRALLLRAELQTSVDDVEDTTTWTEKVVLGQKVVHLTIEAGLAPGGQDGRSSGDTPDECLLARTDVATKWDDTSRRSHQPTTQGHSQSESLRRLVAPSPPTEPPAAKRPTPPSRLKKREDQLIIERGATVTHDEKCASLDTVYPASLERKCTDQATRHVASESRCRAQEYSLLGSLPDEQSCADASNASAWRDCHDVKKMSPIRSSNSTFTEHAWSSATTEVVHDMPEMLSTSSWYEQRAVGTVALSSEDQASSLMQSIDDVSEDALLFAAEAFHLRKTTQEGTRKSWRRYRCLSRTEALEN